MSAYVRFAECYLDTRFTCSVAGWGRDRVEHCHSKGNVMNSLEKCSNGVGLVDEDPGSAVPASVKKYAGREEIAPGIFRLSRNDRHLLIVSPGFEKWLYGRAKAQGIDMVSLGLPADPVVAHERSKALVRNGAFNRLFAALLKRNDPGLIVLRDALR